MPEWLKGADCKSAGYAYVGSNPTPSTTDDMKMWRAACAGSEGRAPEKAAPRKPERRKIERPRKGIRNSGGCSSMVEQKPSKLTTRVRFPSPAPEDFDAGVVAAKMSEDRVLKAGLPGGYGLIDQLKVT